MVETPLPSRETVTRLPDWVVTVVFLLAWVGLILLISFALAVALTLDLGRA